MLKDITYINLTVSKEYTKTDFQEKFKQNLMAELYIVPTVTWYTKNYVPYFLAIYTLNQSAN